MWLNFWSDPDFWAPNLTFFYSWGSYLNLTDEIEQAVDIGAFWVPDTTRFFDLTDLGSKFNFVSFWRACLNLSKKLRKVSDPDLNSTIQIWFFLENWSDFPKKKLNKLLEYFYLCIAELENLVRFFDLPSFILATNLSSFSLIWRL